MRDAEEGAVVIGHIVHFSIREEDTPIEDVTAIFRSGVVRIFCGEELVIACPLFLFLDAGVFHKFIPVEFGKPDRATLTFEETVTLSRPVTMDACVIQVSKCEVSQNGREEGDENDAGGVYRHIFSCVFWSELDC